jgi:pimeloyl-ACP methyl ester carboxylesterase
MVNGLLINYTDSGKGKIVLLLHGWMHSKDSFKDLAKILSANYRVIALDLPGISATSQLDNAWTVNDYAVFLKNFVNKIGVKNIYAMVGHSFGGRVILKSVTRKTMSPQKIIFIDAAGVKPKQKITSKLLSLGRPLRRLPIFRKIVDRISSDDYRSLSGVMRETFKNIVNEDLVPYMSEINQPTLLIWGENDTETPLTDANIFHSKVKNSKLEIIENAGHNSYIDRPDLVAEKIIEWLK